MSNGSDIPKSLRLRVITPTELLVDEEVQEVSLPSLDGELGILPGHLPVVIALGTGPLQYKQGSRDESAEVNGGYAEIQPDSVLVFSGASERE